MIPTPRIFHSETNSWMFQNQLVDGPKMTSTPQNQNPKSTHGDGSKFQPGQVFLLFFRAAVLTINISSFCSNFLVRFTQGMIPVITRKNVIIPATPSKPSSNPTCLTPQKRMTMCGRAVGDLPPCRGWPAWTLKVRLPNTRGHFQLANCEKKPEGRPECRDSLMYFPNQISMRVKSHHFQTSSNIHIIHIHTQYVRTYIVRMYILFSGWNNVELKGYKP